MASTEFVLISGKDKIIAPQEFVTSCITFTSMFEDTGGMNIPLKNIVRPKFGDHRNQGVL